MTGRPLLLSPFQGLPASTSWPAAFSRVATGGDAGCTATVADGLGVLTTANRTDYQSYMAQRVTLQLPLAFEIAAAVVFLNGGRVQAGLHLWHGAGTPYGYIAPVDGYRLALHKHTGAYGWAKNVAADPQLLAGGTDGAITDGEVPDGAAVRVRAQSLAVSRSGPLLLRAKAWLDGQPEPAGWPARVHDPAPFPLVGALDLSAFGGDTANARVGLRLLQVSEVDVVAALAEDYLAVGAAAAP